MNPTDQKHTPTPWVSLEDKKNEVFEIFHPTEGKNWDPIAICLKSESKDAKTNAAFIVRAVNTHEELLTAAKEAYEWLKDTPKNTDQWERGQKLKAAIAKAEPKGEK